jgi:replicative DNA helicase
MAFPQQSRKQSIVDLKNSGREIEGLGKLPPQAVDLEQAVLGVMMLERAGLSLVLSILKHPEVFYKEAHQLIFLAIKRLFEDGKPVDILTITNELRTSGHLEIVGGAYYISELSTKINSSDNTEFHCRILMEQWIKRLLIHVSSRNIQDAYDDTIDAFDLLDKTGRQLMKITDQLSARKSFSGDEIYDSTISTIKKAMLTPGATGLIDGISSLDNVTGGDHSDDLIVIAARPGMGKTAFVLRKMMFIGLELNRPVMMFSLEMSAQQLMLRMISQKCNISSSKIKKGYLSDEEFKHVQEVTTMLRNQNFIIDDTPGLTISQMRAKAFAAKIKHPDLAEIIVDYIQLMDGESSGNREQEISEITRSLKKLAKEMQVPIRALSQLSRSVETRGGEKRPQLSDLRESGAIEQDADVVQFLLRHEYYKIEEFADGSSTKNTMLVIFAKNRHGPLTDVLIGCKMATMDFYDLDDLRFKEPKENIPHPDKFIQSGSIESFENEIKDEYRNEGAPF